MDDTAALGEAASQQIRAVNIRRTAVPWCADKWPLCLAMVVLSFVWIPGVNGEVLTDGLFTELEGSGMPRLGSGLERGVLRSRGAQIDLGKLAAARQSRGRLRLNLFDDVTFEVRIERVQPTRSGSYLMGKLDGKERGEVSLVVRGEIVVGEVRTSRGGEYTIHPDRFGRHVIREVDTSAFSCPGPLTPSSLVRSPPAEGVQTLERLEASSIRAEPSEDGSRVDVLVAYTPGARRDLGGVAGVEALIDLWFEETNRAFDDSGVVHRIALVHTVELDYEFRQPWQRDPVLGLLARAGDGVMDEVHALRNEYAADLVHLIVDGFGGGGYQLTARDSRAESLSAFAYTGVDGGSRIFAHEMGHNMGLSHDRYEEAGRNSLASHPYSYGYVNQRVFEPGASESSCWVTIMGYGDQCEDNGLPVLTSLYNPVPLRFSNPDQTYMGDPLGVPADHPSTGVDGPADARLSLNNDRAYIASFRSRSCTQFNVSPSLRTAYAPGGNVSFSVDTNPGCLWEASSQADWLTVLSEPLASGPSIVTIEVALGDGTERTGTVSVAGQTVQVVQQPEASAPGICGRTSQVSDMITLTAGYTDLAQCDRVTSADLEKIHTLRLFGKEILSLMEGDFAGLTRLQSLWMERNLLESLPEGVFTGLSELVGLTLWQNRITALSPNVFSDLTNLRHLGFEGNQLTALPPGVFAGLSKLQTAQFADNPGSPFPLILELERTDASPTEASGPATVEVRLAQGAPFEMNVGLSVEDGESSSMQVTITRGATASDGVKVRANGDGPVEVRIASAPEISSTCNSETCIRGFQVRAGDPLYLFGSPSSSDVNGDETLDEDDALAMYYAYALESLLGDGETGGVARFRRTLLSGRAGTSRPGDADLQLLLRKANDWRNIGVGSGGDVNGDGQIDEDDALVMYYAYALGGLLGDGQTGGIARFRTTLLSGRATTRNASDDDLLKMLRNANLLRSQVQ